MKSLLLSALAKAALAVGRNFRLIIMLVITAQTIKNGEKNPDSTPSQAMKGREKRTTAEDRATFRVIIRTIR